jgi:hypothetical protein
MRLGLSLLLFFSGVAAAAAPPAPAVQLRADGAALAVLSPALLASPEVAKHLTSGLTTNFLVAIRGREEHARIAIRYEPWDEVFFVHALGADGSSERRTLRSLAELESWWASPRIPFATGPGIGSRIAVTLSVIPFSASEEADAKRWLARSLGQEAATARAPGGEGSGTLSSPSLFSAVVGSSIRRRPVLRYTWTVEIRRRAP